MAVDTGLPPKLELSALSPSAAVRVCRSYWEALAELMPLERKARASCEHFAVAASSSFDAITGFVGHDRVTCEQRVDDCVYAQSEPDPSPAERCAGQRTSTVVADCDATVDDYERCAGAVLDEIDWRANRLTCEALGDGTDGAQQIEQERAEMAEARASACEALERACPWLSVFSDGGLVRVEQPEGAR